MQKTGIMKRVTNTARVFRKAIVHFLDNRPIELAGTTAYFAVFSAAPIVIIIIAVFGRLVGQATIREKLLNELSVLVGNDSTTLIQNAIDNYQIVENSGTGSIIGIGLFLIFATTLFSVMQDSINFIWRVRVKSNFKMNLLKLAMNRVLSFGVILSIGFVLLISLVVDAGIAFLSDMMQDYFSTQLVFFTKLINIVLTLAIIMVAFAVLFRFLPDVEVKWSAAWFGAGITAVLFTLGKVIIGLLVGSSNVGVVYGAAGSLIVLLMWVYYSSLIFYFGTQLTFEFSRFYKHHNPTKNYAVYFRIDKDEERFTQSDRK